MPHFGPGRERLQVFRNHTTVTFVSLRLGAEQTDRIFLQQLPRLGFRPPLIQQSIEPLFVARPVAVFLISVEQLVCRRELGAMLVSDAKTFFEQVSEIGLLAPARELRRVAQAHVNDALHSRAAKRFDKMAQAFFRKADGENCRHFRTDSAGPVRTPKPPKRPSRLNAECVEPRSYVG